MSEAFAADAETLVRELKPRSGTVVDAVGEITRPFVYKVLPDLLGIPEEGREHMYAFGNMVWATMGPPNELFDAAMRDVGPVIDWVERCCERENLAPDSLGTQMFQAADRGEITAQEAKLLVGILLSAAADTTVLTLANAIRALRCFLSSIGCCAMIARWCVRRSKKVCAGIHPRAWRDASRCRM